MKKNGAVISLLILLQVLFGLPVVDGYGQVAPAEKQKPKEVDNSGQFQVPADDFYHFEGMKGPNEATVVKPPQGNAWDRYAFGSSSRLALLVTDEKSDWLGLAHGLKSHGIPFKVTRSFQDAVQHRMIIAYPMVSGRTATAEEISKLSNYVQTGGTLVAVDPLASPMQKLLGFAQAIPSRQHQTLTFIGNPLSWPLEDGREKSVIINGTSPETIMGTHSFLYPRSQVVAAYEDGSAAIIKQEYGRGAAYGVGVDIGHWLLNGYNSRAELSSRSYVNEYEPTLDVVMQWLKSIYQKAEPDAVTVGTVPGGKALSVVLSHDVDFTQSVVNAPVFAEYEKSAGVPATYFIQTKYIRDYYDEIFFNKQYLPYIQRLRELGMEIGSHSVSHSRIMSAFPLGSGQEAYPEYKPYISGTYFVHNSTLLGELRVSKYVLEQSTGASVTSFRAGHLENPTVLPQSLEACGYRYSSNMTANAALTHLPFQLTFSRDNREETDIYEFPITIEDELDPPMDARLDKAIALGQRIARYGGCMVVLIHPNVTGPKLAFEKGLVEAFRQKAWFGSIGEFGRWWAARDRTEVDVKRQNQNRLVQLRFGQEIKELSLDVPPGWTLQEGPGQQLGSQVLVTSPPGEVTLVFSVR